MSAMTTSAPARASVSASARPSPREPPVTSATRPGEIDLECHAAILCGAVEPEPCGASPTRSGAPGSVGGTASRPAPAPAIRSSSPDRLVALHATDPATVFLAVRARVPGTTVGVGRAGAVRGPHAPADDRACGGRCSSSRSSSPRSRKRRPPRRSRPRSAGATRSCSRTRGSRPTATRGCARRRRRRRRRSKRAARPSGGTSRPTCRCSARRSRSARARPGPGASR